MGILKDAFSVSEKILVPPNCRGKIIGPPERGGDLTTLLLRPTPNTSVTNLMYPIFGMDDSVSPLRIYSVTLQAQRICSKPSNPAKTVQPLRGGAPPSISPFRIFS